MKAEAPAETCALSRLRIAARGCAMTAGPIRRCAGDNASTSCGTETTAARADTNARRWNSAPGVIVRAFALVADPDTPVDWHNHCSSRRVVSIMGSLGDEFSESLTEVSVRRYQQ